MLIRDAICKPACIKNWQEQDWDCFIQQGYVTGLLSRFYYIFEQHGLTGSLPSYVLHHFISANTLFKAHLHDIQREIDYINRALAPAGIKPVFLKGAGYIVNQDPAYHGRLFSDVDILVTKEQIEMTEQMLGWQGWVSGENDDYDEKYYRQWMHEIPPLVHPARGVTLDVHHNIVPLIGRYATRSNQFTLSENELSLSNEDKVIHSAVHLLTAGEFDHAFRDITDLYLLIREYSRQNKLFISDLYHRSKILGLDRIVYYLFAMLNELFDYKSDQQSQQLIAGSQPGVLIDRVMQACLHRAIRPQHESCRLTGTGIALFMLYIRSHWLLMPVHILIPHLLRKAWTHLGGKK